MTITRLPRRATPSQRNRLSFLANSPQISVGSPRRQTLSDNASFGFQQTPLFQAAQNRIQHAVRPLDLRARYLADLTDNRVSIGFATAQDRENHRGRRSCNQFLGLGHQNVPPFFHDALYSYA